MYLNGGALADGCRFINGGFGLRPFVTQMRYIETATVGDHSGEFDKFVSLRKRSGNVFKACRPSKRSVAHSCACERLHQVQLLRSGCAGELVHRLQAQGVVSDEAGNVYVGAIALK